MAAGRRTNSSSSNNGSIFSCSLVTGSEIRPRSNWRASRPPTISSVWATVTWISVSGYFFLSRRRGATEAVNQRGGAGGETERTNVAIRIVLKFLFDLPDLFNDVAGMLGQAVRVGRGLEAASRRGRTVLYEVPRLSHEAAG